jgi:hypothetical protein
MKSVSAVGVAKGERGAGGVEKRRSQAGIIFISEFVMKIKLHENGYKYQFMKVNFLSLGHMVDVQWERIHSRSA